MPKSKSKQIPKLPNINHSYRKILVQGEFLFIYLFFLSLFSDFFYKFLKEIIVYRRLREASFLVVGVRRWCWPGMSPYLPLCICFLHSMPNGRKNNDRTHLFFEKGQRTTVNNSVGEKQQRLVVGNRFTCSGAR